ncbi:hypothetical protein GCM10027280_15010 [Micromonospora polyrhachis]|uniref:Putative membrane protein n=1 Tax=Micromonospora polyrhachis TaxID=1282883 RepID=A0A7W7SPV1_9ACTN|nr:hypothetical protein [Micromonospora polyrhachis]MBB4958611.1 putative membrane protein [Micromonospora polyrhachis]
MSEQQRGGFPRRDDDGRITYLTDLFGIILAGLVIGVLILVLFDWVVVLLGLDTFGRANGWLAVILPAWLFVEEFRAWERGPARIAAALVAAVVGIAAGLLVAGLVGELPSLASGALAAAVFSLSYALVWFVGVRWLTRRIG